jgi:hypothetical protein
VVLNLAIQLDPKRKIHTRSNGRWQRTVASFASLFTPKYGADGPKDSHNGVADTDAFIRLLMKCDNTDESVIFTDGE